MRASCVRKHVSQGAVSIVHYIYNMKKTMTYSLLYSGRTSVCYLCDPMESHMCAASLWMDALVLHTHLP